MKRWFCPYCDTILKIKSWFGTKNNPYMCECKCHSFKGQVSGKWIGEWSRNSDGSWSYLHPTKGWGKYGLEPIEIKVVFT